MTPTIDEPSERGDTDFELYAVDTTGDGAADTLRLDTNDLGVVGLAGLHHVSVTVRANGAARDFYVDLLGLVELPRPDFGFPGSWLGTPDGRQVHLIEGDAAPSSGNHVAFAVPDAAAAVAALRAAGLEVDDPFDGPGGRQVFLTDPSGNLIELNEQR